MSKTGQFVNANEASSQSEDAVARRRINMRLVQNLLLIWLDPCIDDNYGNSRHIITQLRSAVNTIQTFTNTDECIQFLENIENDKVCMIVSNALGRDIVPRIHHLSQIDSIFIFCLNKYNLVQWFEKYPKIKGVYTEITPIYEAVKQTAQQCEQNSMSMSFMNTNDDISKKNLDQLDSLFMYTQILKEILLTIEFKQAHIQEFIDYCCQIFTENPNEIKNIKKFEREYHEQTPIWWYTYECFLYPMLNRALRLMNVDIIIKMGFFINDLHRHIEQLHKQQFYDRNSDQTFLVYRGQGMSKIEFEQMSKTVGGLISFNNFLSTSKKRQISVSFANAAVMNPDLVGIVFVMTINPSQSTAPFASITDVSCYKDKEDEVLFAMNTVFRLQDIKPLDEKSRLFEVNLILTSNNDRDLRALTDHIREETCPDAEGWYRLGSALLKMGQYEKAEEVCEILLEQTNEDNERAPLYYLIGSAKDDRGEYQQAIKYYEKALEIDKHTLPANHPDLAASYANMGTAYSKMGRYTEALQYFEKDLEISQRSLPAHHPHLASSFNNIGAVYRNMDKYPQALSYYEKALEIQEKSLPPNHPNLASFYNNIGNVHQNMKNYTKALASYEKALEIKQKSLPPHHPELASSCYNIGVAYESMRNYAKAHTFYERAVNIGQQSLPANHPNLQLYRENLEDVKKKL